MGKQGQIGAFVIEEILNNMRAGAERLYYTVQVPSVYHVYLHQSDYERLLRIESKIVVEARRALDEELAAQNHRSRSGVRGLLEQIGDAWRALLEHLGRRGTSRKAALSYEKGASEWSISLYPDSANGLKVGDIMVESEMATAAGAELGAGLVTKTVRTIRLDGMTRSFEVRSETPTRGRGSEERRVGAVEEDAAPSARALASLRYRDGQGIRRDYLMQKEKINIGSGNVPGATPSYWVDLTLDFHHDVSPLHAQLSYDSASGKFFIKDLSELGTRVDGRLLLSSLGKKDGRTVDLNVTEELPPAARISLADKVILDFKSLVRDRPAEHRVEV